MKNAFQTLSLICSCLFVVLFFSSCEEVESPIKVKSTHLNQKKKLEAKSELPTEIQAIVNNKTKIKKNLATISKGLSYLITDKDFSSIVATICEKNGKEGELREKLSSLAQKYKVTTGQTLQQAILKTSKTFEIEHFSTLIEGFEIEGVLLETNISLGFLNNNGDYFNEGWNRQNVDYVMTGQFQDWSRIPAWKITNGNLEQSSISFEETFRIPTWEVTFWHPVLKELSIDDYQLFAGPSAKCYCMVCPDNESRSLCQYSPSPGNGCSCRKGTGCPGPECMDPH